MLTELLEAVVRRDPRPAGIAGRIGVGVITETEGRFWIARFDDGVSTVVVDEPPAPEDLDALLCIGVEDAEALIAGRRDEPQRHLVWGDTQLLTRFVRRYFARVSWLALRSGGGL